MMVDLRGRCTNTEFCAVAVSQRVVALPEGSNFVCPKCGEPLQTLSAARAPGRAKLALLVPLGLAVVGGGAMAYHLAGPSGASGAPAEAAPEATAGKAAVLGSYSTLLKAADPAQAQALPAQPAASVQTAAAVLPAPHQVGAVPAAQAVRAVQAAPAPVPTPAAGSHAVLLRLAGSDALGGKLARRLASGYLASIGDSGISLVPGGAGRPAEVTGVQGGQSETVQVASGAPASGFAALLRGSADMAMSPRRILPAEAERLSSLGDMTSPANEAVIGIQGVVAVVSPANRLSSLTVAQLRGILAGRLTDWSQVGGVPGPVHVYVVDNQGGTADAPQDLLTGQEDIAGTAYRVANEQSLAAVVASDSANIGFATFGNSGAAKVLLVAENGASPVAPTDLSISTEAYPLSRRIYVYTSPALPNQFVKRFAAFAASAVGQGAVAAEGLVPLTIKAEAEAVPDAASDRFRQVVAGAARLSVNFRFQPGSMELDSRGMRDLDLLVGYLRAQRVDPSRVILAGFADNSGTPAANQAVAQKRAEAIMAGLARSSIVPGKAVAFGAELPVADNATQEGRERNRRVEVYVAP